MKHKFKNLKQAVNFLYELEGKGIHLRLKNINEFLPFLGNPHKKFKCILVGGTNGKGSVSTLLFNAFKEHKIKTALYLSPHLLKFNERIQTNDGFISDKELLQEINFVYEKMLKSKAQLSFFEFLTALAFHYFAKKKVKIAVLEVGLGGRLDATNAVNAIASIITSIDFDHKKFLGNTLKKIATEKAGIIKENSIVVVGEKRRKLQELFRKKAARMNAKAFFINKDFYSYKLKSSIEGQEFAFVLNAGNKIFIAPKVSTKLIGVHQFVNAGSALTTLLLLKKKFKLKEEKIFRAFAKTTFAGRMQLLRKKPLLLADVAHNHAGIKSLVKSLQELLPKQKFVVVFGCSSDKEYKKMLRALDLIASEFILSKASYRAQDTVKLFKALKKANPKALIKVTENAVQAMQALPSGKAVLITGSIFFVSDCYKALRIH